MLVFIFYTRTNGTHSQLNFLGQPVIKKTEAVNGNQTITLKDEFSYDAMQRLLSQTRAVNEGSTHRIFKNTYNELGQLTEKELGGTKMMITNYYLYSLPLQNVKYHYTIRGWLKAINDPTQLGNHLFALRLTYEQPLYFGVSTTASPLYNGNISQAQWKTSNDPLGSSRVYAYHYDALDRIKSATYQNVGLEIPSLLAINYDLSQVSYDRNGNITSLKRNGFTDTNNPFTAPPMDDLTYQYQPHSNRLQKVSDAGNAQYGFKDGNTAGDDYAYDANGNLTQDLNKNISQITYNMLNLPAKISVGGDNDGNIKLYYTATGQKTLKTVQTDTGTTRTRYNHEFIYKNGALQFISQPEGYIEPDDNGGFTYVYQYKDQLGNIRLSYKNTGTAMNLNLTVVQENNYYPFGMQHKGYKEQVNGKEYPYKTFQGQELNKELGLNWISFKYRNYDPAIGRFMSVDPLAEKYPGWSPYNYTLLNPVNLTDPTGMVVQSPIYDKSGNFLGTDDQGLQGKAIVMNESDFTQGMSHSAALGKNQGVQGLNNFTSVMKFTSSYEHLPERPDYNGKPPTISEGIKWAKEHPNALKYHNPEDALYINTSKLDFGNIYVSFFDHVNQIKAVNLFNNENLKASVFNKKLRTTVYALGRVKLKLLNRKSRAVKVINGPATIYDWNRGGGTKRDTFIWANRVISGLDDSNGFRVHYYGVGTLNK